MGKSSIYEKQIFQFLRELSAIVIGIAITVSLGFWVNKKNSEKDLKQFLETIKIEMEENAKKLDLYAVWMGKPVRYALYLQKNNYKSLDKDSLYYYSRSSNFVWDYEQGVVNGGCGIYMQNSAVDFFSLHAFEMLKVSGVLRQIKDKELLMSIWDSYSQMEYVTNNIREFFSDQKEESKKEEQLLKDGKLVEVPMLAIYQTKESPAFIAYICKEASKKLKVTITKLEKAIK